LEDNPLPSASDEGSDSPERVRTCGSMKSAETLETVEEEQDEKKEDNDEERGGATASVRTVTSESQPDEQSQDDSTSMASSSAATGPPTPLAKYMPGSVLSSPSQQQEEYLSDTEPQIFGDDDTTKAPSAITLVHDDSAISSMPVLAGMSAADSNDQTFTDDEEDDFEILRNRDVVGRKQLSIFKHCSPTSCLDTTHPTIHDGEGTDEDDDGEDYDPLRICALARDVNIRRSGSMPFDENLEDEENSLDRFAEELERT